MSAICEICGEPMPPGEEMFKLHGYSGPCPNPPLPRRPRADPEQMSFGAHDVCLERQRQRDVEGWTYAHDDEHANGELVRAAVCYAAPEETHALLWPWDQSWWKPKDRRSNLVRAAALLIAEIERVDRNRFRPED